MKSLKMLTALLLSMALVFSSCGTWNNTQKGAAIGVGGGAAVGAGVGALAGNTALGSVIGAAVGGAAGALIGKKMDKQKQELEATLPEETTVETINNGEALKVTFDSGILFATNSSTLSDASKSALRNLATSLNQNPDTDIKIVGHTDNTGKVDYNQTLSEKRAKSGSGPWFPSRNASSSSSPSTRPAGSSGSTSSPNRWWAMSAGMIPPGARGPSRTYRVAQRQAY